MTNNRDNWKLVTWAIVTNIAPWLSFTNFDQHFVKCVLEMCQHSEGVKFPSKTSLLTELLKHLEGAHFWLIYSKYPLGKKPCRDWCFFIALWPLWITVTDCANISIRCFGALESTFLGKISLGLQSWTLTLKVDTQHENQKRSQPNTRDSDNYACSRLETNNWKTPYAYYKMSVHL